MDKDIALRELELEKSSFMSDNLVPANLSDGSNNLKIAKWLQVLYIYQIVLLFMIIISYMIPAETTISDIFFRIYDIIYIVPIIAFYKLSIVNVRYRKAAIFDGISVLCSLIYWIFDLNDLNIDVFSVKSLFCSICYMIAFYYEYDAHSKITASKDFKLSNRWHLLFCFNIVCNFIVFILGFFGGLFSLFLGIIDIEVYIYILVISSPVLVIIEKILYLVYMKKTIALYRNKRDNEHERNEKYLVKNMCE